MSEIRPLFGFLVISAALHAALLVSSHVRIAPAALSAGQSVRAPLAVTMVSRFPAEPEVVPEVAPVAQIAPVQRLAEDGRRPGNHPDAADAPASLSGDKEEAPVVELSIDDYLPPSLLDKIPVPVGDVDMNIDFKGMEGVIGDAEIMILISSDGHVDSVLVVGNSLPDFVVEQAVKRFSGQAFEPGEIQGIPVRSRVRIRLTPPSRDELLMNPYSAKQRAWHR